MTAFTATIDLALKGKLHALLEEQGFDLTHPPHTFFQGKKEGISCTLYTSGKLVVQGKGKEEFIHYYLEPQIVGFPAADETFIPHIGVDEAGKGDFFGPLVVAAFYADEAILSALMRDGVRDSKQMSDGAILKLAAKLRHYPHSLVQIFPKKYNELFLRFQNLNRLLAWGHATAIENLAAETKCNHVTIDKFADESVVELALKKKGLNPHLTQNVRGESDLVVAAASILARAAFVTGIDKLAKEVGYPLPKGASSAVIQAGKVLVAKKGVEILDEVAKTHFKTKLAILE